eukprot:tig00000863_g4979.t1
MAPARAARTALAVLVVLLGTIYSAQGAVEVSAGKNLIVQLSQQNVQIFGRATGPEPVVLQWKQTEGTPTTLRSTDSRILVVDSFPAPGLYGFTLTATAADGSSKSDQALVYVQQGTEGSTPTVDAGRDLQITLPQSTVTMRAKGPAGATFSWSQITGPSTATLAGATTDALTASGLVAGSYTFKVDVTAPGVPAASDSVQVDVLAASGSSNKPPTVFVQPSFTLQLPENSLSIAAKASDPDGSIVDYSWSQSAGPTVPFVGRFTDTIKLTNLGPGSYEFVVQVTDNLGGTGTARTQLSVRAANRPPVIAIVPQPIITLAGPPAEPLAISASIADPDGDEIKEVLWKQTSGPGGVELEEAGTPSTKVKNLQPGVFVFTVSARDALGAVAEQPVTVKVGQPNRAPSINLPRRSVLYVLPSTSPVALSAVGNDPDGDVLSYSWELVSTPEGAGAPLMVNAQAANLQVTGIAAPGEYKFRVTATDAGGLSATDIVSVVATSTPAVSAGSDISLSIPFSACTVSYGKTGPVVTLPPSKVVLNGSVQNYDPVNTRLSWRQASGQRVERVEGMESLTLKLFDLVPGQYVWEFTATDARSGISSSDSVAVSVNVGPTVVGSADVTLRLPNNSAVLTAAATDVDGRVVSYRWSQAAGAPATLGDVTTPKLLVSNLAEGQYAFAVEVADDAGAKATATIKVSVVKMNRPPTVQFTRKMPIVVVAPQQPSVAQLTIAVLASDPDGDELTYSWTQQSGPALQLEGADTARVRLPLLKEQGSYTLAVTVQDTSRTTTTLVAEINAVPMGAVHAGDDRTVNVPFSSVKISEQGGKKVVEMPPSRNVLEGTAKSVSTEARYYWRKLSGPAVNLDGNGTLALTVIDGVPGTYEFELTVQDFASGQPLPPVSDQVSLHINVGPAALVGADQEVDLPEGSAVELQGKGVDLDGRVASYAWRQVSGPTQASLSGADTPVARASNLAEGRYRFALQVTDNDMATGEAEVLVTVNAAPAMAKRSAVATALQSVDAGSTMLVAWPAAKSVRLQARSNAGADEDGSVTYTWTQKSGPGTAALSNGGEGVAVEAALPAPGVYLFSVSAAKAGAAVSSDVQVTASWSPVIAADAVSAELPASGVVVRASVQDPNGYSAPPAIAWEQLENGMPLVRMAGATEQTVTLSCLNPGTYSLRATATNAAGLSSSVTVPVTVSSGNPLGRTDKWVTLFVALGCGVGWLIAALMGPYGFAFSALQHAQLVASLVFVRGLALPPALLELASGLSWTLGQLPLSQRVYDSLGVTNGKRTIADVCAGAVVDEGNYLASVLLVLIVGAGAALLHALVWLFAKRALKRELHDAVGFPSRTILFAQYFLPGVALAAALLVNEVRRVVSGAQTATTARHLLISSYIQMMQPNAKSIIARLALAVLALVWTIFLSVKLRSALVHLLSLYDGPRQRLADITVPRYRFGGAPAGARIALGGDVEQGRKTVAVEKQRLLAEGIVLSDGPAAPKAQGTQPGAPLLLHTVTGPWRVAPERLEPSGRYLSSYGELLHRFRESPAAFAYPVVEGWEAVVRALVLGIFVFSDGATGGRAQLAGLFLADAAMLLYVLAAWPFVDSIQNALEALRRGAQLLLLGLLLSLFNGGDASPRGSLLLTVLLIPPIVTFVLLLNQIRCLIYAVLRRRIPERAPPAPRAAVKVLAPSMKRIRPEERAEAVFRTSIYVPHLNRTFNVFVPPLVNIPFERRFAGCDRVLERGYALDVDPHTGAVFFLYDARRLESVVYSDEVKRKIGALLVKRRQEALESVPNADQFPFFDDLDISLTAAREAMLNDPARPQYPEYNMSTYTRQIAAVPGRPYVEGQWRGVPFELVGYEFELPLRREHFGAARIAASLDRICSLAKTSSPNFLRVYDYFALRDFSETNRSRVRVVTVAEPTEKPLLKFLAALDTGGNSAELDEILTGIICQVIVAVHSAQNASFDGKPAAFRHGDLSPANIAVKLSEPLRRRMAGGARPSYGADSDPASKRFLFYEVAEKYLVGPSGERQYMQPVSLTVDLARVPLVKIVNFSTSSARVLTHTGALSDEVVRGHLAPPVLLSESYDLKFFAISLQQTLDMYRQRLGPTPPAVRQLLNAMAGADLGQLPAPGERIEIVDSFVALPRTLLDHPSLHTLRTRGAEAGLHPSYSNALHYIEHPHDRAVDSIDLPQ